MSTPHPTTGRGPTVLVTAVGPAAWGLTYVVTTELLPSRAKYPEAGE